MSQHKLTKSTKLIDREIIALIALKGKLKNCKNRKEQIAELKCLIPLNIDINDRYAITDYIEKMTGLFVLNLNLN